MTLPLTVQPLQGDFRPHMEDRHIVIPNLLQYRKKSILSLEPMQAIWYWGVYDGHNGQEISEALHRKLHLELAEVRSALVIHER